MMNTIAACLRLHGYWEDINSQAWMSVCWDWKHSTQSSNNKLSPLPFLPSAFSRLAASHSAAGMVVVGRGGGSLSLFLSFFHFLPSCFCNLSSVASPCLSLVTSESLAGEISVSCCYIFQLVRLHVFKCCKSQQLTGLNLFFCLLTQRGEEQGIKVLWNSLSYKRERGLKKFFICII